MIIFFHKMQIIHNLAPKLIPILRSEKVVPAGQLKRNF